MTNTQGEKGKHYPPELTGFAWPEGRGRYHCTVCGCEGNMFGGWQKPHLRGHWGCQDCGIITVAKLDGTPRMHTRCLVRLARIGRNVCTTSDTSPPSVVSDSADVVSPVVHPDRLAEIGR